MGKSINGVGLTAALAVELLAGCASAPPPNAPATPPAADPDSLQLVKVETTSATGPVSGARCGLKNDRTQLEILAPGVAEVKRSAKPIEILCFAPGYRVAMQSVESSGDLVGPAATGAVVGGGAGALAALPLLGIPVMGPFMYMGAVGAGALLGGTVNAVDKHTQGKIYTYPPSIKVTMTPLGFAMPDYQIAARLPSQPGELPPPQPVAEPEKISLKSRPASLPVSPIHPVGPLAAADSALSRGAAAAPLVPISHEIPEFPQEAVQLGLSEGRVVARLHIAPDGSVRRVEIVEARPREVFNEAVIRTLGRWRFETAANDRQFAAEIEFRR
jgi:protein TonB